MKVFVAYPYSLDGYREALIRATDGIGIELVYADDQVLNQHVLKKVRDQMAVADLCLFDLTGANPNVVLELGIAIEAEHPGVLAIPESEVSKIIADLRGWDSIRYKDYDDLGKQLVERIKKRAFAQRAPHRSGLAEVEEYLREINYGLLDSGRAEASFLVVPVPPTRERLHEDYLEDTGNAISSTIGNLLNETKFEHNLTHFFHFGSSRFGADRRFRFFEYWAVAAKGDKLWSIRLYPSGTILYRTPIMSMGLLGIDVFTEYVFGTCVFAGKLLQRLSIEAQDICIATVLKHLDQGTLGVRGFFDQGAQLKPKQPTPELVRIPLKLRATTSDQLTQTGSLEIAKKFTAELQEWFEGLNDRFL